MKTSLLWIPVLALACAACTPRANLQTPAGFAVLDDQKEYVYRASSADGVVLAVRAEKNEPKGSLDFWAEALDGQLLRSGYARDGEPGDVRTRAGLAGKELKYSRTENGRKYRFWTAVFVSGDVVWVVEAGGDEARFKGKTMEGIQRAIESLGAG
jgi:hypothetical protein